MLAQVFRCLASFVLAVMFKSSPPVPLIEAVKNHRLKTSFCTMREQCHSACVPSAFLCYFGAVLVLLSRNSFVEHLYRPSCVYGRGLDRVTKSRVLKLLVWCGELLEDLCLQGWPVLVGNVNATCYRSLVISFFFPQIVVARASTPL